MQLARSRTPGWFTLDDEALEVVRGVPGILQRRGAWEVHESMLPLFPHYVDCYAPLNEFAEKYECTRTEHCATEYGVMLRSYQIPAIRFMAVRRASLLADEPRIGKTVSALMVHRMRTGSGPLMVVMPLIARGVWTHWTKILFPDAKVVTLEGKTFDREVLRGADIVLAHYDILDAWQSNFSTGTIIFDEAHVLSKSSSKRRRAAALLALWSGKIIALTGTPVWNRPARMHGILSLLAPGAFGSFHAFAQRYGGPESTAYGTKYEGISNADELEKRLSTLMLRRTWADVKLDLPPITRTTVIVPTTEKQLQQMDLALFESSAPMALRRRIARYKVDTAVQVSKAILERGEPVVVWAWHRAVAEDLAVKLKCNYMTGETPQATREAIMTTWRASEAPTALVVTLAVGQVGIDLSHARECVFAEIDYTPKLLEQAEMRTFSPERSMFSTWVIMDHEKERRVVELLHAKLAATAAMGLAAGDDVTAMFGGLFGSAEVGDLERLAAELRAFACD